MREGRIRVKDRESPKDWDSRARCRLLAKRAKDEGEFAIYRRLVASFFPTRRDTMEVINRARGICKDCPVRLDCLAYSVVNYEKVGIWGGETEKERRVTRREARAAGVLGQGHQAVVSWLFRRSLAHSTLTSVPQLRHLHLARPSSPLSK